MHYANKNGTEKDLLVLNGLPKLFHHKALRLKKKGKQIGTTIHVQSTWRRMKTDIPCGRGKGRYWRNPQGGVRFQGF